MKDPNTILRRKAHIKRGDYLITPIPILLDACHRYVIGVDPIPAASWILRRLNTFHTNMALHEEYCRLHPDVKQDQYRYDKLLEVIDQGLIWLQSVGLVKSQYPGYATGMHRFTAHGRDAYFLMLRYCKLCKALNFLVDSKNRYLRFGSAEEERLNITLAGHGEWLEHDWFVRNASWVKEAASLLASYNNLTITSIWINAIKVWKKWSSSYDA